MKISGLSNEQVLESRKLNGNNQISQLKKHTFFQLLLESLGDPIIKILLINKVFLLFILCLALYHKISYIFMYTWFLLFVFSLFFLIFLSFAYFPWFLADNFYYFFCFFYVASCCFFIQLSFYMLKNIKEIFLVFCFT